MGRPKGADEMSKIKEATQLVDVILAGNYDDHKKLQEADEMTDVVLDEVENKIDNVPDQDLGSLQQDVEDELTQDEEAEVIDDAEEDAALSEQIAGSIARLIKEEDYREFFKGMLKKYNVTNPSDLEGEKKKEFFNTVDKEWKAKKETD